MAMASVAQQLTSTKWTPLLWKPTTTQTHKQRRPGIVCSIAISSANNKERAKLKELFDDAYERCRTAPMEGVSFTIDQFTQAIEKYDFESEIGTKVSFFFVANLLALLMFVVI